MTGWSMFLAMFSIMGAARTLPEFMHTLYTHGFYHSLCIPSFIEQDRVSGFWTWMFVLSKVPELGDTIFIVLRKQKLIFLHWYHHITVLIYCWYSFSQYTAPARWFVVMNFIVHSIMYTYYAFKALRSVGNKFAVSTPFMVDSNMMEPGLSTVCRLVDDCSEELLVLRWFFMA